MTTSPHSDPHEPRPAQGADHASRALDENSGYSIDGDTPPAEGLGVGPTNNAMDVEQTGERSVGKIVLIALAVLVVLGVLLAILGRVTTLFG